MVISEAIKIETGFNYINICPSVLFLVNTLVKCLQAVASLKSFMDQIKLLKGERDALEQKFKTGGDTEEISEKTNFVSRVLAFIFLEWMIVVDLFSKRLSINYKAIFEVLILCIMS